MAKVKFKFSVEKITFEYEGDHDTGLAVNRAMNHTLGSLVEAQNRAIDVTPEPSLRALPAAPTPPPARRRPRKHRPTPPGGQQHTGAEENGHDAPAKPTRVQRPRSQGFTCQANRLIEEGFFSEPRTSEDVRIELSKKAFNFETKNIASQLNDFVRKDYLSKDYNAEGRWAFQKGSNDDFPRSQGGS